MPRRRYNVRDLRLSVEHINSSQEYELCTGSPLLPLSPGQSFGDDLEFFRAAWEMHGPRIMYEWNPTKSCFFRPFAWWALEHGEERPINSHVTPLEVKRWRASATYYGYFSTHVQCCPGALQEPELHYLRRRGLLTAREQELTKDWPQNDDWETQN